MEIIQGMPEHAEHIARKLTDHFIAVNKQYTYNKYKTDYQRILEVVQQRLSEENSDFKYFMLIAENGEVAGFANTLNTPVIYEILYVDLTEQYNTIENATQLTQFAADALKKLGADKILTEATVIDKSYADALRNTGAKLIEEKYIIL